MDNINEYILNLAPKVPNWAKKIEAYARQNHIPIMESTSMNVLLQLLRLRKPDTILEIGTAIGYSALRMNDVLPKAKIITIEKQAEMYHTAIENIEQMGRSNEIAVIHGDGAELISTLDEDMMFDFVFVDAAKGQYDRFFELVHPRLNKGGYFIADNVLFRGLVADHEKVEPKRYRNMVKKLHQFNKKLMQRDDYQSSIIPIGDGLLLGIKLE